MDYNEYRGSYFVGIDVGDRSSQISLLNKSTGELVESKVPTTRSGISSFFEDLPSCLVGLEVGTHGPWISALLEKLGHVPVNANPRQVLLISKSLKKTDKNDARTLRRLVELDAELLHPVRYRRAQTQLDLTLIKARNGLISSRTLLKNQIKGLVKPYGCRLNTNACAASKVIKEAHETLPMELLPAVIPLIHAVTGLNEQVKKMDRQLEAVAKERYPITEKLRTIPGIGPVTALAFVLTIDDPTRFKKSRTIGAYLGLVPRLHESGDSAPQLSITKAGNRYVRTLLVQCAQYILGVFGQDSDLRRWGLERAARGGGNAKKRAVVGVARKLGVIMHRMWMDEEVFRAFRDPATSKAS